MSTVIDPKTNQDKDQKESSEKASKGESTEKKRGFLSKLAGGLGGFFAGVVMAPFAAAAGFVLGVGTGMKKAWKEWGGSVGGWYTITGAFGALTEGLATGLLLGVVAAPAAAVSTIVYTPYAGWKSGAMGIIRTPVDMYNYMNEPRSKRTSSKPEKLNSGNTEKPAKSSHALMNSQNKKMAEFNRLATKGMKSSAKVETPPKTSLFSADSHARSGIVKQLQTTTPLAADALGNINQAVVNAINQKPEVNQYGKLEILEGNIPQFTGKNPIAALANCDNTILKQQKYTLTIPDNNEALANALLKEAKDKGIQIDKVMIGKVEHAVSKDYTLIKQNENVQSAELSVVQPPPAKLK